MYVVSVRGVRGRGSKCVNAALCVGDRWVHVALLWGVGLDSLCVRVSAVRTGKCGSLQ